MKKDNGIDYELVELFKKRMTKDMLKFTLKYECDVDTETFEKISEAYITGYKDGCLAAIEYLHTPDDENNDDEEEVEDDEA